MQIAHLIEQGAGCGASIPHGHGDGDGNDRKDCSGCDGPGQDHDLQGWHSAP